MRGIDDTDRDILRHLAADARQSYRAIADAVDLSPPAVADRIDRLRDLGVIQGFTVDLDRSLLAGGTPVLCDLHVRPGAVERVSGGIESAPETEHVFTTADAHVVFQATLAERDVRELLDAAINIESVAEYDVSLLSSSTWTPQVGDVAFAPECVECGNAVDEEGTTARLDGEVYHFCCPSCESQFTERYESFREGAEG
jgi:Lrp/AsnC family leucine-responsive transcriptional regulator